METAATTLPLDTVRVSVPLKNHLPERLLKGIRPHELVHLNPNMVYLGYTDNTVSYHLVVPENNYKVRVTTNRYGVAYFEFSLQRLLYKDNSRFLTLDEARTAINRLCELACLNLKKGDINRLDITHDTNFKVSNHITLSSKLKPPKRHQPKPVKHKDKKTGEYNGNFDFRTKPQATNKRCKKLVLFYDKAGRQRIEIRLFSTATIKASLELGDQNLTLADVLTEEFVVIANSYYTRIIDEMTAKNPEDTLVKNFRKHALEGVQVGALH